MGAALDKPVTEKTTDAGETAELQYGASAMQGWRVDMEDEHTVELAIDGLPPGHAFFAVYDGHGGAKAAELAHLGMLDAVKRQPPFARYASAAAAGEADAALLGDALKLAFVELDNALRPQLRALGDSSGTTAVVVMLTPTHIVCANAGDSRACYATGGDRVVALSEDHKPCRACERERIERAGGRVEQGAMGLGPMRVDGALAVSRGLGDFEFKANGRLPPHAQKVSPEPEVRAFARAARDDEFIVIACDGIWDVFSNEQCCARLRALLAEGETDLGLVAEELLDQVCASLGSLRARARSRRIIALLATTPT